MTAALALSVAMNIASLQTSLRFAGDWPWWAGLGLALLVGGAAWALYFRESRRIPGWRAYALPTMRGLSVAMMTLMLAGPVLHHRRIVGELSKLFVFLDGSASMNLTDRSMDAGRKISVLQRLGLLPPDAAPTELTRASEALGDAESFADRAALATSATAEEWQRLAAGFSEKVQASLKLVKDSPLGAALADALERELAAPARALASRDARQIDDRARALEEMKALAKNAKRWGAELRDRFDREIADRMADGTSPLRPAFERFDQIQRSQRVQSLLLEGESGRQLLARLGEKFDVQVQALDGSEARPVWQASVKSSTLPDSLPKPGSEFTNLTTGIKAGVGEQAKNLRGAVVLLSDGQHNDGDSPAELARVFAGRGLPIFTVGFGSHVRPRDLAVIRAEGPEAVFFEDQVRGEVVLKDDMPAGAPFKVAITAGEKTVWETSLTTDGSNVRKVPFAFPVGDVVKAKLNGARPDTLRSSIPMEFKVAVSAVEGDIHPENNAGALRLRAVTQKRRILLLDGRPRWETRYLRNLFDRDEQWEVNCVIAGSVKGESGFTRGKANEQFPTESAQLQSYDFIIFGDVPRSTFKGDELQWIRDFVEKRGGAIAFIDGARGHLREYAETPLGPVLPVEWKGREVRDGIANVALTERTAGLAAFSLAPDRAQNAEIWKGLQAPRWLAPTTPLPGAEALITVDVEGRKTPAVVLRPFGAGKALYQAFDESWRWRYEVADQHHVRYWNQIANWTAELPFSVRDKFVSLDAGAITYRPGESADIRVRLRDGEGRPVTNATVDAVLSRGGQRVATIRMLADDNAGGLFRGRTAALEPGEYSIAIESAAIPANELKARAEFKVEPRETGELTQLSLNEDLLRQVASTSGGQYFREEQIDRLIDALAPMSQGRVIESDTVLWQSYGWFIPIVLLLTLEWIIRKRTGML